VTNVTSVPAFLFFVNYFLFLIAIIAPPRTATAARPAAAPVDGLVVVEPDAALLDELAFDELSAFEDEVSVLLSELDSEAVCELLSAALSEELL